MDETLFASELSKYRVVRDADYIRPHHKDSTHLHHSALPHASAVHTSAASTSVAALPHSTDTSTEICVDDLWSLLTGVTAGSMSVQQTEMFHAALKEVG